MPGPDYILDLSSQRTGDATAPSQPADPSETAQGQSMRGRPWLAIQWRCCSVYSRIYRNAAGTAYDGRCPRCAKSLHVAVGHGGTSSRFFEAR